MDEFKSEVGYRKHMVYFMDNFKKSVKEVQTLYIVDVQIDLFERYLANLPEDDRQHNNCNACRAFVNRFGGLVKIEKNKIKSVLWNETDPYFQPAFDALREVVEKSEIDSVFISNNAELGDAITNGWSHMAVELDSRFIARRQSAHITMAEKREDFKMISNAVTEYDTVTTQKAQDLIVSGGLNRADVIKDVIIWFNKLMHELDGVKNDAIRDIIIWKYIGNPPIGNINVRNGMASTLLTNVKKGLSPQLIKAKYEEAMDDYQRSDSDPTSNQIEVAEKLIAEKGYDLNRRYARKGEIQDSIWTPRVMMTKKIEEPKTSGVFANVKPKEEVQPSTPMMQIPDATMTWTKFMRDVLPSAITLEALVDDPNRLMAIVTASNTEAPNILKWNNPYSWYYNGGRADAEMRRRVVERGGSFDDVDIRVTLMWNNRSDLDLHAIKSPNGAIFHQQKRMGSGWLDVDANWQTIVKDPVENIRWPKGTAPSGHYKFVVDNYTNRSDDGLNLFIAELEVLGRKYRVEGDAISRGGTGLPLFEFDYIKGKHPVIKGDFTVSQIDGWNVPTNDFVEVESITKSPNLWGDNNYVQAGSHTFFLLEGCKDESGLGRGFINEMLISELHPIRKVLESFTAVTPIEQIDGGHACGIGFSADREWNLTLRVKTQSSTQIIKIDRFE